MLLPARDAVMQSCKPIQEKDSSLALYSTDDFADHDFYSNEAL